MCPSRFSPETRRADTMSETMLPTPIRGLRDAISELGQRVLTGARVVHRSGLLWELTVPGVRVALVALLSGARSPSLTFRIHAANSPDKTALLWRDRRLTYGELNHRIDRVAVGFHRRGVRRGASVLVMMRNRPEFIEVQTAAGRIGAAGVNVSWRSTGAELGYLATNCRAQAIVFEADLWPAVEQATKNLPWIQPRGLIAVGADVPGCSRYEEDFLGDPASHLDVEKGVDEDAAVVVYTSGTTGKPKGAVRKFPRDALQQVLRFLAETPMRNDDMHLVACPLYHTTAFGFLAMSSILGATAVIADEFKPESFLQLVERHRITTTAMVPTMLHRVMSLDADVRSKYDVSSLRAIFTTSAPLPGPLALQVMDYFGDVLFNIYGATETGVVTMATAADLRAAPGTIGKPIPGNEIRLVDEKGSDVASGSVGELYVRNGMLVDGYHGDPDSTRASMLDGFFTVGDLARRDPEGRYFIEGRRSDMIISGGVNVYPAEIEGALEAHPQVAEAAVIGVEDPDWGERVRAFVVPRAGETALDENGLRAWCRERLSGAKVPRDFVLLEALPRNPTGKVLKRELRNWPGKSGSGSGAIEAPETPGT
jgi:fatty-acyl-CoA synthase